MRQEERHVQRLDVGNELGVLEKQAAGAVSGPKSKRDKAGRAGL